LKEVRTMKKSKAIALVVAGLVAGLMLATVGVSYAATETEDTPAVVCTGIRMGEAIRGAGARLVDIVADLTGLSAEEVQAERAAGKSAADIAEANGVSSDEVVAAALEARKAILDAKVADGTLTTDEADAAYERMSDRVTERVTTTETGRPSWAGQGGGMGGGRGGRGGMGGQGACGDCTVAQ
jgi:hypothetical protein